MGRPREKEEKFCKTCGVGLHEGDMFQIFSKRDYEKFSDGNYCYDCADVRRKEGAKIASKKPAEAARQQQIVDKPNFDDLLRGKR